jgi:methyl-accepting chemotaxis protein
MSETGSSDERGVGRRELAYAAVGMLLGIMAPLGWIILRLLLFWQDGAGLWDQVVGDIVRNPQQIAHYLYMGVGTAMVLGAFGYFAGQASQQLHDRARVLDLVNREMAEQKTHSERRFRDLDRSIKNFHVINTDLQKSVDRQEVLRRSADGLHEVIGFDRVNVLMVDPQKKELVFAVSRDSKVGGEKDAVVLPLDERAGCMFMAVRDRQVLLIEDVAKMPEEYHLQPPFNAISQLRSRSFIICPIVFRDQAVGLICVDKKHQRITLVDTDVDTVKLFADQVASSLARIHLLDAVEVLTRQLDHTFADFLKYREQHGSLVHSLRDTIASNNQTTADISSGAGVIQESVAATRSSLGQISVSIDQVSHNLRSLNEFVESSIAAMTEIHYTVNAVQESGVRSHTMSEAVKGRAEQGVEAVSQVIAGMRGIVRSVEQAELAIHRLSSKSEEVGTITSVITGLTQKTSLLALNASIIAAQAGEHGRSFAVVADEVRALAQEAAASTGQINRIIEEIQTFTQETVNHIGRTRQLVDDGMERGDEMGKSLQQILTSSVQAMEMAHDIRRATQEISRSVESVSRSTEQLGEMSSQVSQASREEAQGAKSIVQSVEEVQAMTLDMVAATRKQVVNSSCIVSSVDQVSAMATKIFDEMEARRQASLAVVEDLRRVKEG